MDDKHVINCNDVPEIDMTRQDGGLEHKAGVYTYQIRRSCRTDGDYTYNHAPMLTAFNNRLVLSYISGKRDEHGAPCSSRLPLIYESTSLLLKAVSIGAWLYV